MNSSTSIEDAGAAGIIHARLKSQFKVAFGKPHLVHAFAPGRVNLIGEHTDYNDGLALPMPIDMGVHVLGNSRDDAVLKLYSGNFEEFQEWNLNDLCYHPDRAWGNYVAGVFATMQKEGFGVHGANLYLYGDLPQGSGLSSSAALELSVARAVCALSGRVWEPLAMARLAQKAENDFMGVHCGILDQMAIAAGSKHSAILLDCRSLETRPVPVEIKGAGFYVVDSGIHRELKGSAYNDRRAECALAVKRFHARQSSLTSLRDLDEKLLLEESGQQDQVWYRRARHVVRENARVLRASSAIALGDAKTLGKLLLESHASLRDDYQVSLTELDLMIEISASMDGVYGARLMGAGFGGCTLHLVSDKAAESFERTLPELYLRRTGHRVNPFRVGPGHPARLI